ncbi:MAG: FkbM family methyltransferase, partial [Bryobacteraceae bacterium]
GTFDDYALRKGASKVILVEPDNVNVECIRRNFPVEIANGRMLVVPEGAWSKADTMYFGVGVENSGMGSLVVGEAAMKKIKVPVRPLDEMLRDLDVGKVDFIKVDTEGAEREVLKGAAETLRRDRPLLMLDSYHLPDDAVVLPNVIHGINPAYRATCAACSPSRDKSDKRVVPYVIFFR